MIFPASTCSPPKIFRPRRCPAESRPLREDPPAFLCAITGLRNSLLRYVYFIRDKSITRQCHFFTFSYPLTILWPRGSSLSPIWLSFFRASVKLCAPARSQQFRSRRRLQAQQARALVSAAPVCSAF